MSFATKDKLRRPHSLPVTCSSCGFELWVPMFSMKVSTAGLYDDARFPGRLILSLNEHFEHLEDVPEDLASLFMRDIQLLSRGMRTALMVDRVNVAVLGNQEPHVHAHLIPRRSSADPLPKTSPWDDPRPRSPLSADLRLQLISTLTEAMVGSSSPVV